MFESNNILGDYGIVLTIINTTKQVVFDGDSLTVGVTAVPYPRQWHTDFSGYGWRVNNQGVSGQTMAQILAAARPDAYYNPGLQKNIVAVWGGSNDLFFGRTPADAYDDLVAYCQGRRATGFEVIVLTTLPRSDVGTPVGFEADRQTLNANIVANWAAFADALVDVAADGRIGDAGDENNATYYYDKVHMTTAGYAVIADLVNTVIQGLA